MTMCPDFNEFRTAGTASIPLGASPTSRRDPARAQQRRAKFPPQGFSVILHPRHDAALAAGCGARKLNRELSQLGSPTCLSNPLPFRLPALPGWVLPGGPVAANSSSDNVFCSGTSAALGLLAFGRRGVLPGFFTYFSHKKCEASDDRSGKRRSTKKFTLPAKTSKCLWHTRFGHACRALRLPLLIQTAAYVGSAAGGFQVAGRQFCLLGVH